MRLAGLVLGVVLALEPARAAVRPGLDVLREGGERLSGRIGLITNHTGKSVDGTPTLQVLRDELGLEVVALFSPEHGFEGNVAAGDDVPSGEVAAIPVYSLYGETRAPTEEMLAGIDTLVFDIQDVGVRFYTYISTMKLSMEAAARAGIDFVVLDRPNPLGGMRVEAPVLDPSFASFVGIAPIALVHGMTVGELAGLFRETDPKARGSSLHVVRLRGWKRRMRWEDTGLSWRPPSPNIRTPRAALAYPALGLLEGVNVNEGRGIEATFEVMGAPWIDAEKLKRALEAAQLPGVRFETSEFVPRSIPAAPRPKYVNQRCFGVRMTILDPGRFEAVRTGLTVIAVLRELYPEHFRWIRRGDRYWIDRLLGTDRPRRALDRGDRVADILAREKEELERFLAERTSQLLY